MDNYFGKIKQIKAEKQYATINIARASNPEIPPPLGPLSSSARNLLRSQSPHNSHRQSFQKTQSRRWSRHQSVIGGLKTPAKLDVDPSSNKTLFGMMREDFRDPFEKARETKLFSSHKSIAEKIMCIAGFFTLLLTSIAYSAERAEDSLKHEKLVGLLCMVFTASLILVVSATVRNKMIIKLMVFRREIPASSNYFDVLDWRWVVFEFLLLFVHPSPLLIYQKIEIEETYSNIKYYYLVNEIMTMLCSFKFLYLLGILLNKTEYGDSRSYRVCSMFGCFSSYNFIIKCLLKDAPFKYIIMVWSCSVLYFGWLLMICEAPLDHFESPGLSHTYWNSCWEAVTTMSTVGYGDIYPRTTIGRIVAIGCSLVGTIVVSLLVVSFNQHLIMTGPEASSFTVIKKLQVRKLIKDVALKLIVTINRKHKTDYDSEFRRFSKIKSLIVNFRALRRTYKSIGEVGIYDEFSRTFHSMHGYLLDVKEMLIDLLEEGGDSTTFQTASDSQSSEFNVNDPQTVHSGVGAKVGRFGDLAGKRMGEPKKKNSLAVEPEMLRQPG